MTKQEAFVQVRKYYFCELLNNADTQARREGKTFALTKPHARHLYTLAGIKARADYSVRKHKEA